MSLFRTQSPATLLEQVDETGGFKRALRWPGLIALGIGAIGVDGRDRGAARRLVPYRIFAQVDNRKPFGYILIGNRMVSLSRKQRNAIFRALADPTRREILSVLRDGQKTVGEIADNFPVSRPAISKHLRSLRSAGLIATRRDGRTCACRLNGRPLRVVDEWLRDYESFWKETMQNLKSYVEDNP